tara:strand:+ start:3314 stop:3601 length:288 start_codon:yes stop_codon:yes gene_type:complete
MTRLVKIKTLDFSGKERINAPLNRLLWYFVSFGKFGERYHYKHIVIRKYFSAIDDRLTINISAIDNLSGKLEYFKQSTKPPSTINCRCAIRVNLK